MILAASSVFVVEELRKAVVRRFDQHHAVSDARG
jgi:hypothetical protein